jgi:hypothetical protein
MTAAWVAAGVRARAITQRRLGRPAALALAAEPGLDAAVEALTRSTYQHDVRQGQTLAQAQHAVAQTALWNVRVLAGWLPRDGVQAVRALAGALEIANTVDLLQRLRGRDDVPEPFPLNGLATAWMRLRTARDPEQLRQLLAMSAWGDPGSTDPATVRLQMSAVLADRVMGQVPEAAGWAAGSTALVLARGVAAGRELPPSTRAAFERVVGRLAVRAGSLEQLVDSLPGSARWALLGIQDPGDLWRAEARWWASVQRDALALVRAGGGGRRIAVGAVALLAVDAWRTRAALELAARGGSPEPEDLDAVA